MTLSATVFLVCGLWLVALGLYFVLLRPAVLPEDPRYIGPSLEAISAAVPGLERWLGHVFKVMGGFMVATGAMTVLVACRFLAKRERGTFAGLAVAGGGQRGADERNQLSVAFGLSMAAVAACAFVACRPAVLLAGERFLTCCRNPDPQDLIVVNLADFALVLRQYCVHAHP